MVLSLADTLRRLASLAAPTPEACQRAFGCAMDPSPGVPRRHRGSCPRLGIADLDVRAGASGGIVVVTPTRAARALWTSAADDIGPVVGVEVVSPPPVSGPGWVPRWSAQVEAHGAVLTFGYEGETPGHRLASVSRSFSVPASFTSRV